MNLLMAAGARLTVCAGVGMRGGQILIAVEEHSGDAPVRICLPLGRALELASKIESTYQGIVGPVEPEPEPGDLVDAGLLARRERSRRDEFDVEKPTMQRLRRVPA